MTAPALSPLAAYDIDGDGRARALDDPWPAARPGQGAAWRWLHLSLTDPALAPWVEAHLPMVAGDALMQPETRPRCTPLAEGLIVNLRGINMNAGAEAEDMVSVRIWAAEGLVVSVRLRRLMSIDELRRAAEAGQAPASPGEFLGALAEALTDRIESESLAMEDATDDLEEAILEEERESAAEELAPLRRRAIRLRRFTGPQREALVRLADQAIPLIGPAARLHLGESANRTTRAVEELDAVSARLTALHDHLEAQRGLRMARNGYVLSVVAAIFLPLSFLTGLFGVNVAGMPGVEEPWAFAALAVGNLVLALVLLMLFRALKWL